MDEFRRLLDLADLLERAADALALLAHDANIGIEPAAAARNDACNLAMQLMPESESVANVGGKDTRRLRHTAASSLLRLGSLARTRGATSVTDAAAATQLANELMAVANEIRIEAAGLE